RGQITAHRRNIHWMSGAWIIDPKTVGHEGDCRFIPEMAKFYFAVPSPSLHDGWPKLVAHARSISGSEEIKDVQARGLVHSSQTDTLEPGRIDVLRVAVE